MATKERFEFKPGDEAHIEKISGAYRDALLTVVGEGGLSYVNAAEHLGVAVGTVKSRVNRAKEAILKLRAKAVETAATE